jgi:hypothetical protein
MDTLAGTGGLVRLILRRDRVLLPLWVLGLALIPVSYVSPFADLYPTAAARQQYADNAGFTPSTVACPAPASVSSSPGDSGSFPSWSGCSACSPSSATPVSRRRPAAASCWAPLWVAATPAWRRRWR